MCIVFNIYGQEFNTQISVRPAHQERKDGTNAKRQIYVFPQL